MIDNWKRLRRLMAAYLCRIEKCVITVKLKNGMVFSYASYPFRHQITQEQDTFYKTHSSSGASRTPPEVMQLPNAAEFNRLCEANGESISMLRIDAVTMPSFPAEDILQVVDCFVPGTDDNGGFNGHVDSPMEVFKRMENTWVEGMRIIGVPMNEYVPLRSNVFDIKYDNPHTNPDKIYYSWGRFMPGALLERCDYDAVTANPRQDYPVDALWIRRAIFELMPVHLYQRIVYGEHGVTMSDDDMYEVTTYAPIANTSQDAEALMSRCTDLILSGLKFEPKYGLAYAPCDDSNVCRVKREYWPSGVPFAFPGDSRGLYGMPWRIVEVEYKQQPVKYTEQLQSLALPYTASDVYTKLAAQHDNDVLNEILTDAWQEPVQEQQAAEA